MSCNECDDNPIRGAYLRFGNEKIGWAAIEIVACEKHWKAAREKLLSEPEPSHADAIRRLKVVEAEIMGRWNEPEPDPDHPICVPLSIARTWADELAGVIRLLEEGAK